VSKIVLFALNVTPDTGIMLKAKGIIFHVYPTYCAKADNFIRCNAKDLIKVCYVMISVNIDITSADRCGSSGSGNKGPH